MLASTKSGVDDRKIHGFRNQWLGFDHNSRQILPRTIKTLVIGFGREKHVDLLCCHIGNRGEELNELHEQKQHDPSFRCDKTSGPLLPETEYELNVTPCIIEHFALHLRSCKPPNRAR